MTCLHKISRRLAAFAVLVMLVLISAACGKKPQPVKTGAILNTEPAGAAVTIKGRELGTTPLKIKVRPGVYLVKFSLDKYKNSWQKIKLDPGDQKNLTFKLDPETASVMITCSPDAGMVTFQNRNLGMTPVVITGLPHGRYTAEVHRHGYTPQTVSWNINSALPKLVKTSLETNLGTLVINSKPDNAEVFLDGKSIGRTPFREQIEEGKHKIELRRNGYNSLTKIVQIKRRTVTSFTDAVLEVKSGSIKISSRPSKAIVYINGKHYGDTPVALSNLPPGSYAIRLEKDGYDPAVRRVNLPAGEKLDLMLNMDSNTGGIDVVTQPPGITLYLDGKLVGRTEKDPANKNISRVFTVRNLSAGSHRLTYVHKRAKPEKRFVNFKISKGQILRLDGLNLWIPNVTIVRDDGKVETGRIVQNLPSKYEFEPLPGVRYTIDKSTVKKVTYLPETE